MDNSVILITPADQSHAYEAQSRIRELSSKGAIDLFGQAVIQTDDKGTPTIKDSDEPALEIGTITGGLLGSVIGILGGPVGVLLGFSAGAATGSASDVMTAADAFDALPQIAARMKPQTTALVIAAREPTPDAVDALAEATNATVSRWPVEDVLADVYAAREAADKAAADARRAALEAKTQEVKTKLADGWANFTAQFDTHKTGHAA